MKNLITMLLFKIALSSSPFLSLQNTQLYSIIEYELLSNNDTDIFTLNQPYKVNQVDDLLSRNNTFKSYFKRYNYWRDSSDERINIKLSPNLNNHQTEDYNVSYLGLNLDGVIRISDAFLVNEIELSERFKYDSDFHGDSGEWLMGYFNSSYALLKIKKLELFGGRISRNFGTLNDFGLILSENPYAFDHYGFSLNGNRMQYSFYTTRLNNILGIDIKGESIPIDSIATSQRFWAVQRLDYKINKNFQVSLSESTIYGGPNQQFIASYLNPTQFFYAAQRNQGVQLNGFWQINIFYQPIIGLGLYLDLFADDIIVNNDPGVDDRAVHPDRLGILLKASFAQRNKALMSLRYVRIWNETYTSYRTFENYTYFNKGLGFPNNSFESIKYTYTLFQYMPTFIEGGVELWRQGNRNLVSPFHDELNTFPVSPVLQGATLDFHVSTTSKNMIYEAYVNLMYKPKSWNASYLENKDNDIVYETNFKEIIFGVILKFSYNFNYNKL